MKKQTKLGLVLAAAAVISVSVASLVSAKGWVQKGADWYYVDNDGEAITDTIQSSGTAKFYLGPDDGAMQKDYFLEDKDGQSYYFGSNGAMVTNTWVAIESSRVDNQGDYVPDNYWYYFQASGKAMKGSNGNIKKTTIDGKKYAFNEHGQMLTGWFKEDGVIINPDETENPFVDAVYYAGGDNDGVLRSGWVTYYDGWDGDGDDYQTEKTNLYFYFNTSNNKMIGKDNSDNNAKAKTKKINGKTYAFSPEGIMLSGWDVVNDFDSDTNLSIANKTVYLSGEDDGHQVKKGWVYTVPAQKIDSGAYDDGEEKYMYFNSSGDAVVDSFKKINGKNYVFDYNGIMKTGLVMWCQDGYILTDTASKKYNQRVKYVKTIDLDWATGDEYAKKGILRFDSGSSDYIKLYPDGTVKWSGFGKGDLRNLKIRVHYYGDDGARKTGTNNVEFSDGSFSIATNASGDKGSMPLSKKYYALGMVLKASSDIKYGIYAADPNSQFNSQIGNYANTLSAGNYLVLTTSGSKQKGAVSAKKDADGNYWLLRKGGSNPDTLLGIYTVNTKWNDKYSFTVKLKSTYAINTVTDVKDWLTSEDLWDETIFDEAGNDIVEASSGSPTDGYYPVNVKVTGYFFQTDYNGGSNKWVPFGFKDDTDQTAKAVFDIDDYAKYYQVYPTDDYFLNCYWKN